LAFEREQRQWNREEQRQQAAREAQLAQQQHEIQLAKIKDSSKNNQVFTPQDHASSPTSVSDQQSTAIKPSDDELVAFVREQVEQGQDITGTLVAEFLGVSDRTGRRRIKELQAQHPELFLSTADRIEVI